MPERRVRRAVVLAVVSALLWAGSVNVLLAVAEALLWPLIVGMTWVALAAVVTRAACGHCC
jgi:hypothetical protein